MNNDTFCASHSATKNNNKNHKPSGYLWGAGVSIHSHYIHTHRKQAPADLVFDPFMNQNVSLENKDAFSGSHSAIKYNKNQKPSAYHWSAGGSRTKACSVSRWWKWWQPIRLGTGPCCTVSRIHLFLRSHISLHPWSPPKQKLRKPMVLRKNALSPRSRSQSSPKP